MTFPKKTAKLGGGEFFLMKKQTRCLYVTFGWPWIWIEAWWVPLGPPWKHTTPVEPELSDAVCESRKKKSPGILGVGTFRLFKAPSGY